MTYLDSAATTFQKPPSVRAAMLRAVQTMSSPGRGGYASARAAEELLFRTRTLAAETFGVASPERVVFTASATHGLNVAIKSLVPRGGRAVISGYEHNAVTRPLYALDAETAVAESPLFDADACLRAFDRELRRGADAAVCATASNVFGCVLPIAEVAALCRRFRVPLIVDASQSAGVLPLDMAALGAAFVAMPGHKGLYAPQGTGLLLCGADAATLLEGGTGSASLEQAMPDFLPDRLEAGTHNVPGIAGLEAGLRYVRRMTPERIACHERRLIRRAAEGLRRLSGVTVYASEDAERQLGVLSFNVAGREPEDVAEALAERGIAVRAGYHCAPTAHRSAGTLPRGTVRASVSAFSTDADVDALLRAMRAALSK
ncbi:MAG: aminotransferase class V-fold PLP-dependent enzyme [Oscillospiraceae bacterium]|nr:aminotransferase class V-fold PLP-dependent enzyme [Oscillospiraceae bacterium]